MSKTKEDIAAMPPYERKAYLLFCEMYDIDDIKPPHIVSYLCKRNRGDPEITGKVFEPPCGL